MAIDERVSQRGYFNVALKDGDIILRSDRYVGLIPLNADVNVQVRPRASIADLTYLIARSGVAPVAIQGFSRRYHPRFQASANTEEIYRKSLIAGAGRIIAKGLLKAYLPSKYPVAWRGRLLVSDTIKKHVSRGVRYRHRFEVNLLELGTVENIAIKYALRLVVAGLSANQKRSALGMEAQGHLLALQGISPWSGDNRALIQELGRRLMVLPPQMGYYRDALWSAYLIIQGSIPDVAQTGMVALDSLIIDISKVFESYVRRILGESAREQGWRVIDGNSGNYPLFVNASDFRVKPDIIIADATSVLAVIDVKYKIAPKESDRYELIAFMEALGAKTGAFVSPVTGLSRSRYMGKTKGGKNISDLRFDMAASSPEIEATLLCQNVARLINGTQDFE
jgi:hypothetical protein